jgi:hypothetical protein
VYFGSLLPNEFEDFCIYYELNSIIHIVSNDIYVNKDDLDKLSEKYGIPRKTRWVENDFKVSEAETSSYVEIIDENSFPNESSDSPQDLIICFIRSVLIHHPKAKTADLRRYCFEDMKDLNSRDSKIINNLLILAGALKSKKGEHANHIEYDDKYPKAQWKRVFDKKNFL